MVVILRQIILYWLLGVLTIGCSGDEGSGLQRWGGDGGERPAVDGGVSATKAPDASPSSGDSTGGDSGAGSASAASGRPNASTPEPTPAKLASCGLAGSALELGGVVGADMRMLGDRPLILAIIERERSEPLDIEGSEPLPGMRSLYLFLGPDDEDEGDFEVVHIADDPGPIRDHFGRRSYEYLVAVRAACDGSGCLVALSSERVTPGTKTRAFLAQVLRLDEDGEPQGDIRSIAQEPDRGTELASCLGISNEGFLWATSVRGGRGRLLWLDRRATPLDMRYFTPGFEDCAIAPLGLALEVAVEGEGGIRFESMGGEPEEADAGPGPWRPTLAKTARAPGLAKLGEHRVLAWSDGSRLLLSRSGSDEPIALLDAGVRHVSIQRAGDELYLAFVEEGGDVGVSRLDAELAQNARGRELVDDAERAWVLAAAEGGGRWLGWQSSKTLRLQQFGCPAPSSASAEGGELATRARLVKAEARNVQEIRRLASRARSRGEEYRAAWLYERAYHHNTNDVDSMIRSAGLLTEIRYTKSSLRQLQRLADRDVPEIRAALRGTCNDRDFERLWSSGDFQRITGCAAPPDPEEEEEEEGEGDEGDEGGDDESGESESSEAASEESESSSANEAPAEPAESASDESGESSD